MLTSITDLMGKKKVSTIQGRVTRQGTRNIKERQNILSDSFCIIAAKYLIITHFYINCP